jgi:antitoxin CptB
MQALSPTDQARLRWRCRRGMLELDILLGRFCDRALSTMTLEQLHALEALLETPDPELLSWLMGESLPESTQEHDLVRWIQSFLNP